jgi:photosystem II stability/assembly factor-like uncharacterized protein
MKRKWLSLVFVVLSLAVVAIGLACVADLNDLVWAASPEQAPTIVAVDPSTAPNDLDTPIVITGTGFTAVPTVTLGSTLLDDVGWVSSATLTATVPWGLITGTYTMTVANPDGITGTLPNAFTVTQGIGVWNAGELYGGLGRQVVINPLTPTTLYVTSEDVGVFRTRDGAGNWAFTYASPVGRLSIDPISPNRLYLAAYPHAGGVFYRSDDEGSTWITLTTTFPATGTVVRDCSGGWGMVAHPSNPGTVYAYACDAGDGKSGLLRSTNWGQDWTPAMGGITDTQVTALAFHPDDPDVMVLGTAGGNVYRTTDGGAGWTHASAPVEYVGMLAVNPFGAHDVWVGAQDVFTGPCALLKSADADLTAWVAMEAAPGEPVCAESAIRFAPLTWGGAYSGTVFVAGHGDLYKTSNGGSTWAPFGGDAGIHDIALHPTEPNTIYLAHYRDAVHKTTDGGASWQAASQGLTAMFPWQLAAVPGRPEVVFARIWGWPGVFRSTRGGATWQFLQVGDEESGAESLLVDPTDPTRVYVGVSGRVYASTDSGDTWPTYGELVPPTQYADCNQFPKTLLGLPGQRGTLLAGVQHWCGPAPTEQRGSIYRSTDYGEHWERVHPAGALEISPVSDLAYDPASPLVVYAATGKDEGGGLFKSIDGGQDWYRVGASTIDTAKDVVVEPGTGRVFVTKGCCLPLYVSDDGGENWTATGYGGGHNVHDILFAPGDPPILYDAAQQGLYRSIDGAGSWQPADGELGQVTVYALAVVTESNRVVLYAGTSGGLVTETVGASMQPDAGGTLVNAGVYRHTILRLWWVYLPVVARQQ